MAQGGKRNKARELLAAGEPVISVVTVCYHAEKTLESTLTSLIAQTDSHYECIIVDGGSGKATLDILQKYDDHIDKWISEPDGGIYNAMNKGALLASGQFIAFLNADDQYLPQTIENWRRSMAEKPAEVYYGNLQKEVTIEGKNYQRIQKPNLELMPKIMGIFHPAMCVRMDLFRELNGFDERYRLAADYDFTLRAYLRNARFHYIDIPLAIFSISGATSSGCDTYREALQIIKRNRSGHSFYMFRQWMLCKTKSAARKFLFILSHFRVVDQWKTQKRINRWK